MRNLTSILTAAAFFLISAESFAASKPNTNVRVLLPAVNVAAKPKPKPPKQQYMIIKLENVMISSY
jgi:hypothetical protein